MGLTDQERIVVNKLADAWNEFVKLPVERDHDQPEFAHHMHVLQGIVLKRPGRRELNGAA